MSVALMSISVYDLTRGWFLQDTLPGQPHGAQTYSPSMVQAELGEGGVQIGLPGLVQRLGLMERVVATAWRSADRRLSGAQAELALQEESVRRSRRECRATLDQMAVLERSLQATESELRASQVGRREGPMGADPRGRCGPLPESQPLGTTCGSSLEQTLVLR